MTGPALLHGLRLPAPSAVAACIVAIDLAFVAIAAVLGALEDRPDLHLKEHSIGTWLSAVQLFALGSVTALLAHNRTSLHPRTHRNVRLWMLLSAGFVFLALDELTSIHEAVDEAIHRLLGLAPTAITDRLDDLIVAAYGIVGAWVLWRFREELREFQDALPLLAVAFALFFTMAIIDTYTDRPDLALLLPLRRKDALALWRWLQVVEEGLKLLGGGLFLAVGYRCLWIAVETARPAAQRFETAVAHADGERAPGES